MLITVRVTAGNKVCFLKWTVTVCAIMPKSSLVQEMALLLKDMNSLHSRFLCFEIRNLYVLKNFNFSQSESLYKFGCTVFGPVVLRRSCTISYMQGNNRPFRPPPLFFFLISSVGKFPTYRFFLNICFNVNANLRRSKKACRCKQRVENTDKNRPVVSVNYVFVYKEMANM